MRAIIPEFREWLSGKGIRKLLPSDSLVLAALTIAGVVTTLHAPTIFLGPKILFASLFSLAAFLLYRSCWGVAVAIPSALATIWIFGDSLTAIRLIGEMAFISWINRGPCCDLAIRRGRIVRDIVLYALLIASPFLFSTELFLNGTRQDIALTLVYKNFINSVFNVLVAYAVYSWIELKRNKRREKSRHQISLQTLASVLLVLICIILSYILIKVEFFIIANERNQLMVLQRNHSLATLIQKVHIISPIEQVGDLDSLLVGREDEMIKGSASSNMEAVRQNEYDLLIRDGKTRILKPNGEVDVWYSLRLKDKREPLQFSAEFFRNVLPGLSEYRNLPLVSPRLSILAPRSGSPLDRLTSAYWKYEYQNSKYSEPQDIQIFTPIDSFVNDLSVSINAALRRLAEVVLIALVLSNAIAKRLTGEWIAIIPKGGGRDNDNEIEELYNQSPITEISASVDQINHRTAQIIAAKKQIEYLNGIANRQLSTAAEIQSFFLVKTFPNERSYTVTALTDPAFDVGGDWYDVFTIGTHSFFVVADVCDKGVASALFMSVFRTLIRYGTIVCFANNEPGDVQQALISIVTDVNNYMSANHGGCMYFATVFFAHISEDTSLLSYVSAGHEAPLLRRREGRYELLQSTGPALGLFEQAVYASACCTFDDNDVLLAYTDGVTDACNAKNERFHLERLQALFDNVCYQPVEEMQEQLIRALRDFMNGAEQFDDITMMFIKRQNLAEGVHVE
ncbi:PP2C family protein-serine/threonine phosphatase [Synechococcus sp. EJ6-Ellesmere]|uniref:PP2C family protein-serine/threonine phosphatase n=1 Tax=Synechococcus sp. EJ6-Ellesmere TaxID=2823734 RepID=UPI0020CE3FE9|nr:PP2C family protein-serine/threonine phosphatase [Synechococcus sp. EJ6-Ellesmere]MCP9826825.1 serine/threonine-protein phosphatase [Synechococcus sp. EJ6-Ellesmere]